jgi:hypothetical protein
VKIKFSLTKNLKFDFSIGRANISQLFLLDKLDKVYNAKNIFWIATLYCKIDRKITFLLYGPIEGARRVVMGQNIFVIALP